MTEESREDKKKILHLISSYNIMDCISVGTGAGFQISTSFNEKKITYHPDVRIEFPEVPEGYGDLINEKLTILSDNITHWWFERQLFVVGRIKFEIDDSMVMLHIYGAWKTGDKDFDSRNCLFSTYEYYYIDTLHEKILKALEVVGNQIQTKSEELVQVRSDAYLENHLWGM